ncbi:Anaphase-promoting complex subunit 4 [Apostasia shenzhenica]|uniref:Anaphase-promoting complex subunit 4 n=1 Tax=Apostasia shenzhenica TaxID=1088818 RepID=A0A2I0A1P0_9ASPA|nr:Anaphase-promoting complex subunit 4 [Apostasia shenzhenica]
MAEEEEVEMEAEESSQGKIPFQLQFDKQIPFQVKIAEWNPEKDLLAMVTGDNKILLHRFNWQRLWTLSPGKCISSLCWRPDGKAIALGLDDGSISLHDVENGKLLRTIKAHNVHVTCLSWEEHVQSKDDKGFFTYKDRTARFFPPSPRIPRLPGLGSGDTGFTDDREDSFQDLSNCYHHFNILCSGDKDGCIYFSIFGIFQIGKINIQKLSFSNPRLGNNTSYRLPNASIQKVALSKDLRKLIVLCSGEVVEDIIQPADERVIKDDEHNFVDGTSWYFDSTGLHLVLLNTSIFLARKHELHQVALQASNIVDLIEVVRSSLFVMSKLWSSAINSFHEKFNHLSSLIVNHGLDCSPQDEFMSLLFGSRTSPALHQFLVNSLGEAGIKRVFKSMIGTGKELHRIIREHLQPAVEVIGFRVGELKGLSRWHARFQNIGLDESLVDNATERAGMLLVQVERFARVLAVVIHLFQNFFNWLTKCIKILLSEPTDQIQQPNSELVVIFLKFIFENDPVGLLLEISNGNRIIVANSGTTMLIEELVGFGGFSDTGFLERTLAVEFSQLEQCFKEVFLMPFVAVSKKIYCEDLLPLYPFLPSPVSSIHALTSISSYKGDLGDASACHTSQPYTMDYICFRVPNESSDIPSCICILKGFACNSISVHEGSTNMSVVLLYLPKEYQCVDLSLYKENQLILLLGESTSSSESPEQSWMMMLQMSNLPFVTISRAELRNICNLLELKACCMELNLSTNKVRCIPHAVTTPLAVSSSRGVASVFSTRKHALVYILDEDEDEGSDFERD